MRRFLIQAAPIGAAFLFGAIMKQFVSDIPEGPSDQDEADELLCDVLIQWQESGRSPAAMINAMVKLVNDIVEHVAEPMQ